MLEAQPRPDTPGTLALGAAAQPAGAFGLLRQEAPPLAVFALGLGDVGALQAVLLLILAYMLARIVHLGLALREEKRRQQAALARMRARHAELMAERR